MRRWVSEGVAMALVLAAGAAFAQSYPDRPIRLVVPFAAGGSYDPVARVVAHYMGDALKQQIVTDNRGGASGQLGGEIIARANPDGYTVGILGNNHTITAALKTNLPFDVLKDFVPLMRVGVVDNAVVVHPSVPAKSLKELVALFKANPGKYNFGSGGAAGTTHFAGELFNSLAGTKVTHVPYKSGGPATVALVAGETQMMVLNMINADPHIKAGRLRGLAMASKTRHPLQPDLPTAAEAGLPGLEMTQWYGLATPLGVPKPIVGRWLTELKRMVENPEVVKRLGSQGVTAYSETPAEFLAFMKSDIETNRKIAKAANIKAD
jgi:tripartite-type tricarboxylate transporter receptor subunit TctC